MFQKRFIYISSCLDVSHLLTAFVPFLGKIWILFGDLFHEKQDWLHGVSVTKPPVQGSFSKEIGSRCPEARPFAFS
jgi:hypothetical protein